MSRLTGPLPHPTGPPSAVLLRRTGRGFTLVELLLTVVLLLLLASAAVISFNTLLSSSELDEGAAQMEGLMRFARAHAANTGKKVQLVFEEQTSDGLLVPLGNVRVFWEADPLRFPGQVSELGDAAVMVENVNKLVQVEEVRFVAETETVADGEEQPLSFAPITFYPDGSSESAEIILSSRSPEELRRVSIRVTGITGVIKREWVAQEEGAFEAWEEELFP